MNKLLAWTRGFVSELFVILTFRNVKPTEPNENSRTQDSNYSSKLCVKTPFVFLSGFLRQDVGKLTLSDSPTRKQRYSIFSHFERSIVCGLLV